MGEVKKRNENDDFIAIVGVLIIVMFLIVFFGKQKDIMMNRSAKRVEVSRVVYEGDVYDVTKDQDGKILKIRHEFLPGYFVEVTENEIN